MSAPNEIQCPRCPHCDAEPYLAGPGLAQAFCGTDDCRVFCWDPYVSKEENLADEHEMLISEVQDRLEDEN